MSSEGLRRPVTISVACLASLTLAYVVYRSYKRAQPQRSSTSSLHRSNAIRRSHRRHGSRSVELTALDRALLAISASSNGDRSFGQYAPESPAESELQADTSLDLNPPNLEALSAALIEKHPEWDESTRDLQYTRLQSLMIVNLVSEFWPDGTTVGDDEKIVLVNALRDVGIDSNIAKTVIDDLNHPWNRPRSVYQVDGWGRDGDVEHREGSEEAENAINEENLPLEDLENTGNSQNMLNLLFNIAGEQARREGYVHRGIECNGCGACPIQGIRYHCANCFDYDLCETCESKEVHIKSHVFYKIRIPAPSRGQIKQVIPKWYPGNPNVFPQSLPKIVVDRLVDETETDRQEIAALFEQFKCLAGCEYPSDPCHLGVAIDRKGFDMYFIPGKSKSNPANLIYDRMFGFYDTNDDGLIGFDEFIKGLARLHDKSRMARLRRIFDGYDLDGDGFVSRKDFLRMFRAYYDLSRQLNREMISAQEDFGYLDEEIREVVQGSQPISAAFGGNFLFGHESRAGEDKRPGPNGDLQVSNGPSGVLQNDLDMRGDRVRAIGNAAIGNRPRSHPFRTFRTEPPQDEALMQLPLHNNFELIGIQHADDATEEELTGPNPPIHTYGWPPLLSPDPDDIITALGSDIPVEEITDPLDRSRVIYAQSQRLDADSDRYQAWQREKAAYDRWKRRQFYLDQEEGLSKPQGYTEPDSSDEESDAPKPDTAGGSRRHSLRSRSPSKVRFDDSAIDTDYETRSNASSRSIPQNERWGGYELSQPEFDVGRDVLYEAVQQGFNELLDNLFKRTEDEAMDAVSTRRQRSQWKVALDHFEENIAKAEEDKEEALKQADALRTEAMFASAANNSDEAKPPERTHQNISTEMEMPGNMPTSLHEQFGDQIKIAIAAAVSDVKEASMFSRPPESVDSAESERDPTLPQFRPDSADGRPKAIKAKPAEPPPTKATFEKWLRHRQYEQEALKRGGPGKLSFIEFRSRMVASDEIGDTPGNNKDNRDENDPAYWEKSADLGRLSFVGTWLEMASF